MLGASKSAMGALGSGGGAPAPALSASVSPNQISTRTSNGTYTTPSFTASAFGGTAPYTYQWSVDAFGFSIINQTPNKVKVRVSGYNTIEAAELKCKVTDSASNEITVSCGVSVIFSNQQGDVILP